MLTQSALARVGSLVELQFRIYCHGGGSITKYKIRLVQPVRVLLSLAIVTPLAAAFCIASSGCSGIKLNRSIEVHIGPNRSI